MGNVREDDRLPEESVIAATEVFFSFFPPPLYDKVMWNRELGVGCFPFSSWLPRRHALIGTLNQDNVRLRTFIW